MTDTAALAYRRARDLVAAIAALDDESVKDVLRALTRSDDPLDNGATAYALASIVVRLSLDAGVPLDPVLDWLAAGAFELEDPKTAVERGLAELAADTPDTHRP